MFANEYANFSDYNKKPLIVNQTDNSTDPSNLTSEESIEENVNVTPTIILRKKESNLRFSKISSSENKLSNSHNDSGIYELMNNKNECVLVNKHLY